MFDLLFMYWRCRLWRVCVECLFLLVLHVCLLFFFVLSSCHVRSLVFFCNVCSFVVVKLVLLFMCWLCCLLYVLCAVFVVVFVDRVFVCCLTCVFSLASCYFLFLFN